MIPVTRPVHRPTYNAGGQAGRHAATAGIASHSGQLIRKPTPRLVALYGPAGIVGPVGATDHPYVGMDPSDPVTWTRPYAPAPGMIAFLNFNGAVPNQTQTVTTKPKVAPRPRRKRRMR